MSEAIPQDLSVQDLFEQIARWKSQRTKEALQNQETINRKINREINFGKFSMIVWLTTGWLTYCYGSDWSILTILFIWVFALMLLDCLENYVKLAEKKDAHRELKHLVNYMNKKLKEIKPGDYVLYAPEDDFWYRLPVAQIERTLGSKEMLLHFGGIPKTSEFSVAKLSPYTSRGLPSLQDVACLPESITHNDVNALKAFMTALLIDERPLMIIDLCEQKDKEV